MLDFCFYSRCFLWQRQKNEPLFLHPMERKKKTTSKWLMKGSKRSGFKPAENNISSPPHFSYRVCFRDCSSFIRDSKSERFSRDVSELQSTASLPCFVYFSHQRILITTWQLYLFFVCLNFLFCFCQLWKKHQNMLRKKVHSDGLFKWQPHLSWGWLPPMSPPHPKR